MVAGNRTMEKPAVRELVITRVFDAPPQRVFNAWTDPEQIKRWWGPKIFTVPVCTVDLRPGGLFHFCMRSPEGLDVWGKGVYREIVEPERLVYMDSFADAEGNTVPATHYGMDPDWPLEVLTEVTFTEEGGKTRLTLRSPGIPISSDGEMAEAGWNESLDRLADYLAQG